MKRRIVHLWKSKPRALIFDPKHEYMPQFTGATDELAFLDTVEKMADDHAPAHWALLRPTLDDADMRTAQFERFCTVAGQVARELGGCLIIVDELHLVTESGRASAAWGALTLMGRSWGCHILAASIRPATIDKDFWDNLTYINVGRLGNESDVRRCADRLGVDRAELAALPNLHYFERDLATGAAAVRGETTF